MLGDKKNTYNKSPTIPRLKGDSGICPTCSHCKSPTREMEKEETVYLTEYTDKVIEHQEITMYRCRYCKKTTQDIKVIHRV